MSSGLLCCIKQWIINTIPDYAMTYWWQAEKHMTWQEKHPHFHWWLRRCPRRWKNTIINILTILVVLKQVLEIQLSAPPFPKLFLNIIRLPQQGLEPLSVYLLTKSLHVKLHRYAKYYPLSPARVTKLLPFNSRQYRQHDMSLKTFLSVKINTSKGDHLKMWFACLFTLKKNKKKLQAFTILRH